MQAPTLKEAEKALKKHPAPDDISDFEFKKSTVSYDLDPVFFDKSNPLNNVINASRIYSKKTLEETDELVEWRLTMSSTTATVTTAKRAYAAPGSYPLWTESDYQSGGKLFGKPVGSGSPINVKKTNGKMEVCGVDIVIPCFKLELGYACSSKVFEKLIPVLLKAGGMINQDIFKAGPLTFQPGELLFSDASYSRIEEVTDPDTGETEIRYKVNYTFDISFSDEFQAGDFHMQKEMCPGFSVKHSYFDSEEEVEMESENGKKQKVLRPHCAGAYSSDVYTRVDYKSIIPSGIQI